ncbi:MAG: DUF1343 domain-containing protein [Acidobacteriota bacterium]
MILTGLDRLLLDARELAGRRYAFLGHGASVTADGRPGHLALVATGTPPTLLLGPEHGYHGIEQDMIPAAGGREPWTGIEVVSLYGSDEDSLRPDPETFAGLDLLLIDLQDVGSRYYTYVASALWAAEAAFSAGCEVWILDRPNPLGGAVLEGPPVEAGYDSFVSAFRTPVRHGCTLGELARLEGLRRPESGLARCRVWPVEGWQRDALWPGLGAPGIGGRPWVSPSPNMPSLGAALVYPGTCLVEATELSEGRGTARPFEWIGAPWLDPVGLAERLAARELPGVTFLPLYFRPQFQKHSGTECGGVQLLVTDFESFHPLRTGVEILFACRDSSPMDFRWREAPYEFVADRPAIDLLTGGEHCRRAMDEGDREAFDRWIASWTEYEASFAAERREILLYDGPGGPGDLPA